MISEIRCELAKKLDMDNVRTRFVQPQRPLRYRGAVRGRDSDFGRGRYTGFDSKDFRKAYGKKEVNANMCFNKRNGDNDRDEYFDQELYDQRYAIELTNACMDSYRSLLNRLDTTTSSWKGLNYLVFILIAAKKFSKEKSK